jgi:hypothetical protein
MCSKSFAQSDRKESGMHLHERHRPTPHSGRRSDWRAYASRRTSLPEGSASVAKSTPEARRLWSLLVTLALTLLIVWSTFSMVAEKSTADSPRRSDATATDEEVPSMLDLDKLEQRLRATDAIGFFTKVALGYEIDDLLDTFRDFHRGQSPLTREHLWDRYDLLLFKVITLLQDEDPELAQEIYAARERLWELLLDPNTFAKS